MLELDAARFVTLCQALQGVRMAMNMRSLSGTLAHEEITDPPWYLRPIAGLLPGYDAMSRKVRESGNELVRAQAQANAFMTTALKEAVSGLAEILEELGLQFSLTELRRLERDIAKPGYVPEPERLDEISSRIRDELDNHLFLQVSPALARLYEPNEPLFGQEVTSKFPSLIYEIEEAGICYALDRSAASAFHSMRCLEGGIRALSRCLKIPDPTKASERNWGDC